MEQDIEGLLGILRMDSLWGTRREREDSAEVGKGLLLRELSKRSFGAVERRTGVGYGATL